MKKNKFLNEKKEERIPADLESSVNRKTKLEYINRYKILF